MMSPLAIQSGAMANCSALSSKERFDLTGLVRKCYRDDTVLVESIWQIPKPPMGLGYTTAHLDKNQMGRTSYAYPERHSLGGGDC